MIFGHLLTCSNYDDSEERLAGGRHGYGAKLTNIFSKRFQVELNDSVNKLYVGVWWSSTIALLNCMRECGGAQ